MTHRSSLGGGHIVISVTILHLSPNQLVCKHSKFNNKEKGRASGVGVT